MNNLLKNPLFKFIGTITVIYFVAFHNSKEGTIGSALKSNDFKSQVKEIKNNSSFIIQQVSKARQLAQKEQEVKLKKPSNINSIYQEDLFLGKGSNELSCGDEAIITYEIYDDLDRSINRIQNRKILLTKQNKNFINQAILGMRQDAIRLIYIPKTYPNQDAELKNLLNKVSKELKYKITLVAINKTSNCK